MNKYVSGTFALMFAAMSVSSCGNGARERGAILKHPAMQEAYELGKGV